MMNELAVADITGPDRVFERAEDQVGVAAVRTPPAHDPVGEHVTDRGQPEHALGAGDARGIGDPEPVWPGAVNSRLTRSGAGVAAGFCRVEDVRRFLRR
jgi:predicted ThiF/HesA family dinucleotide-utilizing enzyme